MVRCGKLESRLRTHGVRPLAVRQYKKRKRRKLRHLARTVAAGPREKLKEEPRIDWTVDNVVGVRNYNGAVVQPCP